MDSSIIISLSLLLLLNPTALTMPPSNAKDPRHNVGNASRDEAQRFLRTTARNVQTETHKGTGDHKPKTNTDPGKKSKKGADMNAGKVVGAPLDIDAAETVPLPTSPGTLSDKPPFDSHKYNDELRLLRDWVEHARRPFKCSGRTLDHYRRLRWRALGPILPAAAASW
ncbi:hypothetical protein LX36DRAFT_670172 [Colletotrichum falcatum]|nr:hypothetical protein LX36DRAFT_670172 [Colletotrichum falcatum]